VWRVVGIAVETGEPKNKAGVIQAASSVSLRKSSARV